MIIKDRALALRVLLDSIGDRAAAERWMAVYLFLGCRVDAIVPYGSPEDPFHDRAKDGKAHTAGTIAPGVFSSRL